MGTAPLLTLRFSDAVGIWYWLKVIGVFHTDSYKTREQRKDLEAPSTENAIRCVGFWPFRVVILILSVTIYGNLGEITLKLYKQLGLLI
jgi:hypothetical protein